MTYPASQPTACIAPMNHMPAQNPAVNRSIAGTLRGSFSISLTAAIDQRDGVAAKADVSFNKNTTPFRLFIETVSTPVYSTGMTENMQPDELLTIFRRNVKARRSELGLTQAALAERAGVEQSYISDLENGKKRPLIDTLAPLAEALDTTPSALLSSMSAHVLPV